MRYWEVPCLHELFEMQVDQHPSSTAIVSQERCLTYKELDDKSNQLARYLRIRGVKSGDLIPLYLNRSEQAIIAILAILKAGAAYIPIDPSYPKDRILFILETTSAKLLLSESCFKKEAESAFESEIIFLDEAESLLNKTLPLRLTRLDTGVQPHDLCYILYTSGTTGQPKGIMTEHRNVVRFTEAFNEICQIQPDDRVYQGFSLTFDGSVEEIWMALSHGASLIIGKTNAARLGNEAARLMNEEKVTIFSTVPTFLGMMEEDIPTIRLLIVSGEPCPPPLVNKWASGERRMLNVYGPTETTVNATVAECIPNRPVTIGRPLKHYSAYILDEKKEPVAPGETGELYIAGDGVARGYFRQPELSKEKFIADILLEGQRIPRLYRTGDLVRLTPDGELDFCGRMDTQVKIRGYRVELSEIESVLRELDCIQHAVVRVYNKRNLEELAAYVTTKRSLGSKDYRSILEHLQKRLPAFMVPSYLETLDFLPTLTSGKVDRKKLPDPRTPLILTERFIEEPKNETEWKLLKVWEKVFDIRPISTTDDFFLDLAGYSLIAAEAVSLLRHDYGFHVSLRDVYENPTIQGLAQYLNRLSGAPDFLATHDHASPGKSPSQEAYESVKPWIRRACTTVQALIIIAGYALASLAVGAIIFTIMLTIKGAFSAMLLAWILAFTLFFGYPTWVLTTVLGKWLVIGRIKPGRYPLWGFYYLRWWITVRLQAMSGMGFFISTPLLPFYMRLMGAKIGSNCVFDTALFATYDLLSIGDETSIGSQSQLLGYRIEDGVLVLGRIKIGKRCYVGTHSTLGIDVSMGDDCRLGDLSFLEDAMQMLPQTSWRGSPARPGKVPVPDIPKEVGTYRPCLWSLIHYVSLWSLMLSLLTTTIPPVALIVFAYFQGNLAGAFLALVPAAPLLTVCYCLFAVLAKLILLPKARPGVYPVMSLMALRKWLLDTLMVISRGAVHTLYTTLYLPIWLRMLGAKIGSRAEISTVSQLSPELVTIGDESFFADGSIIGYRKVFRGHVEYARSSIGRRSFVGNNAMLTVGYELEDNCLLGCLSVPPEDMPSVPAGSEWLGSPSFRLPHRKKIESFPIAETFHPNLYLYAVRCFIDGMRIMIPNLLGLGALLVFITCAVVGFHKLHFWWFLAIITPLGMALTFFLPLSVIGLKIMLMGQFKPVIKPLWSVYVWLNELINGAYETIGAPVLSPMLGTPFFAQYLRCLGCKIGKHTYIGTTLFSEFDLVEIGDYVALNAGVVIQNHLFEDRVMKSSYLKIGDGCSIGNMAVILYDTEIQERCSIAPLSLLMKGEVLTPHTRWVGIPTQQIQNNSRQGEKPFIPISLTSKRRATMN